jgi:thiaminase/transcriptional activator TenA
VSSLPLSQYLWRRNSQLVEKIRSHPFVKEIESGTLDKTKYDNYIYQDNLYLNYYARAFLVIAAKTKNNTEYNILMQNAGSSLEEHDQKNKTWDETKMNSVNLKYTNFFTAAAWQQDQLSALVSLTPCGRLYAYLGRELAKNVKKDNPFYDWIVIYNSTEFHNDVSNMEGLVDNWGLSVRDSSKLEFMYATAMHYEFEFFDVAYE